MNPQTNTPNKDDKKQPAQKPEQKTKGKGNEGIERDDNKKPSNLPTADRVAAKENSEVPENDETMSDQPDAIRSRDNVGPGRSKIDTNTMSDQGDAYRNKA